MLFCPSFTQSERFLHTDQLITRLRRVEPVAMINFIRMLSGNVIVNVFKSDAVIWWAAIFRRGGRPGEGGRRTRLEPIRLVCSTWATPTRGQHGAESLLFLLLPPNMSIFFPAKNRHIHRDFGLGHASRSGATWAGPESVTSGEGPSRACVGLGPSRSGLTRSGPKSAILARSMASRGLQTLRTWSVLSAFCVRGQHCRPLW